MLLLTNPVFLYKVYLYYHVLPLIAEPDISVIGAGSVGFLAVLVGRYGFPGIVVQTFVLAGTWGGSR